MLRRNLLGAGAAAGASSLLPRFSIAQPANSRVLRFIPQSDVGTLDPIVTTAYVTRNHAFLIWDTLYGLDADLKPQPQMVEGHVVEDDGRRWTLTLRPGLKFHDGEPVRAQDCVASIKRWQRRDPLGQELAARTDDLLATDDRTIVFRLKKPFPLLPDALGKVGTPVPFMMPERLANTDPFRAVTEFIGSGPFRFKPDERVQGSRFVYERFADYRPRESGTPAWTSGPKRALVDRVEWRVTPDSATASAALQSGEVDWWENPPNDLLPPLRRARDIVIDIPDPTGQLGFARFNHLHAPFNNPKLRQALLGAINQADFMTAAFGDTKGAWRDKVGFFPDGTPFASDAGMAALTSPRDLEKVKREVAASGYKGEPVVLLGATDFPIINALCLVGADLFKQVGLNVDYVSSDWGTVVQRRNSREPVEKGGWSVFFTYWAGFDTLGPGVNQTLRGNGTNGWFGWASSERLEAKRAEWFDAPSLAAQQQAAREQQAIGFEEVPALPLGQAFVATAYRRNLVDLPKGPPFFWNARKV
ncbi:ABC transporter substrate-binding protein [Paeniroseomonas aquatica]|uniref:ABC transporter substrate-binding protein n=1 Tax=Paeniroseomonas aquatica TaxID=373043 RepID=A0ABT8A6C8_9PROT|nr:ABC transporter substrate-binding protein [Paeniroseomonas aquatica]MDN3565248.1 ABC transporter substrate-binding protein [Paeniroseomonas aquatica]